VPEVIVVRFQDGGRVIRAPDDRVLIGPTRALETDVNPFLKWRCVQL
jgi:hypothetical protein